MDVEPGQQFELIKYFPLIKIDEATHTAYGLATCEKVDKEGELCDYEGAKNSYQEWTKEAEESTTASGQGVSLGNIRYMHQLTIAGKATKVKFDDVRKQIWLESTPAPPLSAKEPDVWPLLRDGFLRGYSQGGKYISRVCNECRKNIQGNFCDKCDKKVIVRYIPSIAEVSYVDNPCLKEATFTLVKSDGSVELKKFSETPVAEVLKGIEMPTSLEVKTDAGKYSKSDLPYRKANGKLSYRLMAKAWKELHNTNYIGSEKKQAVKLLKQLFAKEGLDNPTEKSEVIDIALKTMVEDRIQCRAFGQLGKGMYDIGRLADVTEQIKFLWMFAEYERDIEQDDSPVTDDLKAIFEQLLDAVLLYCEEEVEEERERLYAE